MIAFIDGHAQPFVSVLPSDVFCKLSDCMEPATSNTQQQLGDLHGTCNYDRKSKSPTQDACMYRMHACRASMVSLHQLPPGVMELMKGPSDPVRNVFVKQRRKGLGTT